MRHPPNVFAPFGKSAIVSYHLVNVFVLFCKLGNTVIPSGIFFGLKLSARVENSRLASSFLISDCVSSSARASKSSIFEMQ